ncbi:MAG: secreted PhoX family phosphatase [Verrucomicrobiales bacterium]|jgi:secreted PhoX family phosphatase
MNPSRREFFKKAAAVTTAFAGLSRYASGQKPAHVVRVAAAPSPGRFGPLQRDPKRIFDLPAGFNYKIIGRAGDYMEDGLRIPGRCDGMGAFAGPDGKTIIVRNHELESDKTYEGPYGLQNELFEKVDISKVYDPGQKSSPHIGGTTTVVFDTKTQKVEKQFLSLAGTCRNCAGGITPWGSWITCEETVEKKGTAEEPNNKNEKDHGYPFEVPATTEMGLTTPIPLKAMGRFNHEAVAIDPATGIVYQTEDRHDGLFWRFIPKEPGKLAAGGKLQFLCITEGSGRKQDQKQGVDTRNWRDSKDAIPTAEKMSVEWKDIDGIDSPNDDLRKRGYLEGGARFARTEGIWFGDNELYFACTNGGRTQHGQVFRYVPSPAEGKPGEAKQPGQIELFVEPNDKSILQSADNLTISPWGDLVVCEDGPRSPRMHNITPEGSIHVLGQNSYNDKELAGVCFSPDGSTLFVNIFDPGITLAITGPWA